MSSPTSSITPFATGLADGGVVLAFLVVQGGRPGSATFCLSADEVEDLKSTIAEAERDPEDTPPRQATLQMCTLMDDIADAAREVPS